MEKERKEKEPSQVTAVAAVVTFNEFEGFIIEALFHACLLPGILRRVQEEDSCSCWIFPSVIKIRPVRIGPNVLSNKKKKCVENGK
jgi:hypothetical protein